MYLLKNIKYKLACMLMLTMLASVPDEATFKLPQIVNTEWLDTYDVDSICIANNSKTHNILSDYYVFNKTKFLRDFNLKNDQCFNTFRNLYLPIKVQVINPITTFYTIYSDNHRIG